MYFLFFFRHVTWTCDQLENICLEMKIRTLENPTAGPKMQIFWFMNLIYQVKFDEILPKQSLTYLRQNALIIKIPWKRHASISVEMFHEFYNHWIKPLLQAVQYVHIVGALNILHLEIIHFVYICFGRRIWLESRFKEK